MWREDSTSYCLSQPGIPSPNRTEEAHDVVRSAPAPSTSRPVQDLIGVAENVTFSADPAALFRELLVAAGMTLRNPAGIIAANTRLLWGYAGAFRAAGERAIGRDNPGPIAIARGDKRFADPAYQQNPAYFLLAQQYLLFSRLVDELLDTAGVSGSREAKARFIAKFLVDALAPTNTLAGNPAALRKAFDTGGKSIVNGLKNWVQIFATTVDGRRKSTAPDSRSASTWLPRREAWSTAATSSS